MAVFYDQLSFIKSPSTFVLQPTSDTRAVLIGFRNVLAISILYEVAILLWALGSGGVTLPAFLRIPEEQYYYFELIFLIPMFVITWLVAAGIAYVMSIALGGNGPFDAVLGVIGVSMAISFYFSLIPDIIQGILWTTGWIPFHEYLNITSRGIPLVIGWTYLLAWVISPLILYSVPIHHTQGLNNLRSTIAVPVSFLGSFAVWITIVR